MTASLDVHATEPASDTARPLRSLRRGQSGHVKRLDLPATLANRLAGLGVCEGRLLEVVSTGDPMIVRACGSTLALGKAVAAGVELCVCDTPSCPYQSPRPGAVPPTASTSGSAPAPASDRDNLHRASA